MELPTECMEFDMQRESGQWGFTSRKAAADTAIDWRERLHCLTNISWIPSGDYEGRYIVHWSRWVARPLRMPTAREWRMSDTPRHEPNADSGSIPTRTDTFPAEEPAHYEVQHHGETYTFRTLDDGGYDEATYGPAAESVQIADLRRRVARLEAAIGEEKP